MLNVLLKWIFFSSSSHRQINVTGTDLNGIHVPKVRLIFPDAKYVDTVSYSWLTFFVVRL